MKVFAKLMSVKEYSDKIMGSGVDPTRMVDALGKLDDVVPGGGGIVYDAVAKGMGAPELIDVLLNAANEWMEQHRVKVQEAVALSCRALIDSGLVPEVGQEPVAFAEPAVDVVVPEEIAVESEPPEAEPIPADVLPPPAAPIPIPPPVVAPEIQAKKTMLDKLMGK